jgi:RTX calcium-binding nonapeptide repeat (4 copies)
MSRPMRTVGVVGCLLVSTTLLLWITTAAASPGSPSSERSEAASRLLAPATPTMITFEADGQQDQPEPFTSSDNPTVHFVDTIGVDIDTLNVEPESDGIGLRVFGDDPSAILILFDVPTTRVSILFGNDDACCSSAGDLGTLIVYRNGVQVATRNTVMNRDDMANQRVTYTGSRIDKARFVYTDAGGAPIDLIEVVDNIIISPVCTISGNFRANRLNGTPGSNGICGRGGADVINGRAGNDWISGGDGNDTLTGGDGDDLVVGGAGADLVRVSDGVSGNDTVFAGGGNDTCRIDEGDTAVGCESVITIP